MDDSDGLGNRIVIIVYTSVFYELSVALVPRVGRRWCGETPCGGFGAGFSGVRVRYREIERPSPSLF